MRIQRTVGFLFGFSCLMVLFPANYMSAHGKSDKYVCAEPQPQDMCNPSNTCGSSSMPCVIDVRRSGSNSASSKPNIPNAKSNAPFCIQAGTTVVWESSSKDTGFVIDFGPSTPFEQHPGAIIGGTDRKVTVVPRKTGCFKYSVGACTPGAIYGMCGNSDAEMVVTGPK